MAILLAQTPVRAFDCATVTCGVTANTPTDSDADGFTDYEECCGITLADGSHFKGFKEGGECLDPNKKDVFVILIPATPSNLPLDPLQLVKTLPINIHLIQPSQATSNLNDYTLDRIVSPSSALTPKQKAVRITEDLTPYNQENNPLLGKSGEGTLIGPDSTLIFTERTKGYLTSIYLKAGAGTPPQDVLDKYYRHIIAHEFGHSIRPLAPVSQADYVSFGGYHYKTQTTYNKTNVIMDQYVTCKASGGTFNCLIGTIYTPADIAAITLR